MEIIPLLTIKNRVIQINKDLLLSLKELTETVDKDANIYFIDVDGLEQNKPNFCTYQRLSSAYKLWVDFGPRSTGDVVDVVIAGAQNVIIRKKMFKYGDIQTIKNMIDNPLYEHLEIDKNKDLYAIQTSPEINGIIIQSKDQNASVKSNNEYIVNNMIKKHPIVLIEPDEKNFSYWQNKGITSIITDFITWKKVKKID